MLARGLISGKRVTGLVVAVALAIGSLGVPMPVRIEKQAETLFPCMNCPCGCAAAETCWRDCCCYTHEQKLDWAEKNAVIPPAYVLALRPSGVKQVACYSKKSCCEHDDRLTSDVKSAGCQVKRASGASCCQTSIAKQPQNIQRKSRSRKSWSVLVVVALRCQGLGANWTLLPPALPASGTIGQPLELLPTDWVMFSCPLISVHFSEPATPPPRIS